MGKFNRLKDLLVTTVALVDRPANKRKFLLMKREGGNMDLIKDEEVKQEKDLAKIKQALKSLWDALQVLGGLVGYPAPAKKEELPFEVSEEEFDNIKKAEEAIRKADRGALVELLNDALKTDDIEEAKKAIEEALALLFQYGYPGKPFGIKPYGYGYSYGYPYGYPKKTEEKTSGKTEEEAKALVDELKKMKESVPTKEQIQLEIEKAVKEVK